jgi:uncharacterized protein YndB with AHSA1/START domain
MEMVADDGALHTAVGGYRELRRPERVVYTWSWEGNEEAMSGSANTLVEVDFTSDGDGTLVTLTHTGFGSDEVARMHEHGWNGTLEQLAQHLG